MHMPDVLYLGLLLTILVISVLNMNFILRLMGFGRSKELKNENYEDEPNTEELQLDQSLQDHIVNVPEETDDSHYEANIMKRLSDSRISIYYSNYTSSNVLVKGRRFGDYSIEISSPKATTDGIEEKSISDWEGSENFGIRYAIRVVIAGTNFLIWGNDREDALLNLIAFAAEFECNYF